MVQLSDDRVGIVAKQMAHDIAVQQLTESRWAFQEVAVSVLKIDRGAVQEMTDQQILDQAIVRSAEIRASIGRGLLEDTRYRDCLELIEAAAYMVKRERARKRNEPDQRNS